MELVTDSIATDPFLPFLQDLLHHGDASSDLHTCRTFCQQLYLLCSSCSTHTYTYSRRTERTEKETPKLTDRYCYQQTQDNWSERQRFIRFSFLFLSFFFFFFFYFSSFFFIFLNDFSSFFHSFLLLLSNKADENRRKVVVGLSFPIFPAVVVFVWSYHAR